MEANELKTGSTKTYEVGGKKLVVKPVTLGKMKKAMLVFKNQKSDSFDSIRDHLTEMLANGENPFATKEWIEDNITMPIANEIINDMRIINGMGQQDVFPKGAPTIEKELIESQKTATPSV